LHGAWSPSFGAAFIVSAGPAKNSRPFEALSNVQPLRPIRVLLAGREVRYLRAVAFLFERRGCETCLSLRPASLFDDAERFRPEVVVLVEGGSFADAVGQAVALIGRSDRLGVVLATSRPDLADTDELRFVPRWVSFAELNAAVEQAWLGLPSIATVQSMNVNLA
jgi:hypothetical protein